MYPEDLDSTAKYGRHMVIFYINVNTKGKTETSDIETQKTYEIPTEDLIRNSGQRLAEGVANLSDTEKAKIAGGITAAVATGIALRKTNFGKVAAATAAAAAVTAGAGGAGVLAVAATINAAVVKRLDTAIALYMPNSVKTNYDVMWEKQGDETFKNIDLVMSSAQKVVDSTRAGDGFLGSVKGAAKGLGAVGTTGAGLFGLRSIKNAFGEGAAKYTEKAVRVTEGNAKEEQTFEGVNFRTFDFVYNFMPKSPTEAENILNIIRMFRYHMLPEFLDELSFMYIYPSEFNIKYYSNNKENEFIERISTCVLTSMNVDYTPNGEFSSFKTEDNAPGGMPTHINLQLSFKELSKPSKETSPWNRVGM
jgi:hypothetical protein